MRHAPIQRLKTILVAGLFIAVSASHTSADPLLRWNIQGEKLMVGDQVTISVMLDDSLDVRTVELVVRYDPSIVTSVSGEPGALFDGLDLFPGFVTEGPDTWRGFCVVMGADEWAVGPGELYRWTVRADAEGHSPLTGLEVSLLPPGGGDYPDAVLLPADILVGDITVAFDMPASAPTIDLSPNPFNPRTRVTLALPGGGSGRLDILDVRGRALATPWRGTLGDAPLSLDWQAIDKNGLPLASGVYVFRLRDDRGRVTLRTGSLVR